MGMEFLIGRLQVLDASVDCFDSLVTYSPFAGESRKDFLY